MELYNTFNEADHLVRNIDKSKFEHLHTWDLGWELLQTIDIATDKGKSEIDLSRRLSPGQKALYFFWYLDAEVDDGEFIAFYEAGYVKYIPPIKEGLKLIGDWHMLDLVEAVHDEYLLHEKELKEKGKLNNWDLLDEQLYKFDAFDERYAELREQTMQLLEDYIRKNVNEFVKLT